MLYPHVYIYIVLYNSTCIVYCVRSSSSGDCQPTLESAAFASVQFQVKRQAKGKRGRTKKARSRNQTFNVTFELSGFSLCATVSKHLQPDWCRNLM